MNSTQMHERLRMEMLRRIHRGTLSVTLLSRQTGLGKSHVSGFLHGRRRLSMAGMDRVLGAQHMTVEDLLDLGPVGGHLRLKREIDSIPVVSHAVALLEPLIRPSAIQMTLNLPPGALPASKTRVVSGRRFWDRFVAIRIAHRDALPMDPLLQPDTLAVIDRHFNSLIPYRAGRPNLYAVRDGAHLALRYADFVAMRLILRPLSLTSPINLIEIGPDNSPGDLIAGRVVLTINQL